MKIKSPITNKQNVELHSTIRSSEIIEKYKKFYQIDVSEYFNGIEIVKLFKCIETGYMFFYPETISGKNEFYEKLELFEWYYMPWKWEHKIALNYVRENSEALEIGCANGTFIEKIKIEKNCKVVGLELNYSAYEKCKRNDLEVYNELIQEHSLKNQNKYDFVLAFEVLEHVSNTHAFIKSSIKCLKDNGILILAVPNNNSFIKHDENNILNMPPHHMGLWSKKTFLKIEKYFNLKLQKIHYEPLQEYHKEWFDSIMRTHISKITSNSVLRFFNQKNVLEKIIFKFAYFYYSFRGHTMLAVFKKIEC